MTTNNNEHLKTLFQKILPGTVMLAGSLIKLGISRDLQQYYKKSGWIKSIGSGAFIRAHDKTEWDGGIYALQNQEKLNIYPGGLTALTLQGFSHYVRLNETNICIFYSNCHVPKWLKAHDWGKNLEFYMANFLPNDLALSEYASNNFTINISSPGRAILECLYLSPLKIDLIECYHIIEGLANLRPALIQELLEKCTSIKVKRLFLYMARKANHAWFKYIDVSKIDLGSGVRSIIKEGAYDREYRITMPKELKEL